jgi:hypothetical protein
MAAAIIMPCGSARALNPSVCVCVCVIEGGGGGVNRVRSVPSRSARNSQKTNSDAKPPYHGTARLAIN